MDVILLIVASFYVSRKVKGKGYSPTPWVLRLIGTCLGFEILGVLIALAINGGNLILTAIFGFVCAVGGFLLIKSRLDKLPYNKDIPPAS